ncbi:Telomeric repeat-binding factor 1 [Senna tora]|uniref:Telomeric repeat-binding factor 1 n=1 Tax=Senna tora TaxID=362788 RepID=A0A835CFT3_9FABA|nr:Telomeric repeat-binding factor 1 [Senna tora]
MDADVARWILEFVLRSNLPDSTAKRVFNILPVSTADSRLKKTILLRHCNHGHNEASVLHRCCGMHHQIPRGQPGFVFRRRQEDLEGSDWENGGGYGFRRRAYLAETWELMGPSFLELAAALSEQSEVKDGSCGLSKDATDRSDEGGDIGVVESDLASD